MFVFVIIVNTPQIILEKVKSHKRRDNIRCRKRQTVFYKNGQFPEEDVNLTYRLKVQSLQLPKSKLS